MENLESVFTKDVIQYYKSNKHLITAELLETLRTHGNPGKEIAFEILDLEKTNEGYYLDSFNNKIKYNGIITLKGANVKIPMSDIHKEEIQKCNDDIYYFMDNYCKIVTKSGVTFPELREYQREYLDSMVNEEATVSLQSRQSGKSIIASVFLLHLATFKKDILIGIAANKNESAKEILDKIKKIYMGLPIWFMQGLISFNKTFVEFENGVKILTDSTNADSFRGYSVNCLYLDEVAWVKPSQWEEFADAVFPTQGALAWKKTILTSTMKGMNHWYDIVKKAKKGEEYKFHFADWKDVPRYNKEGEIIDPEAFKESVIKKHGILYFNQNYLNEAVGSSHTLIHADTLKTLEAKEPELILDNKLKVYHKPESGHQYIMAVDPAKDGLDAFSIQVMDITNFTFRQVASAKLQIDYLLMPEFIDEWCSYYNKPYLIIENNEGAGQSIADQMYQTYEYENLHFDSKMESNTNNVVKSRKKYPGFRTTVKSRKQILQTMKTFIENGMVQLNDNSTIKEFFTFILVNNKYQADEGTHDDMIMSLAIVFAIFNNTKNFSDMKEITKILFKEDSVKNVDVTELITIGSFDDGTEMNDEYTNSNLSYDEYTIEQEGFI